MVLIDPESFTARANIGSSWEKIWKGLLEGKSNFITPSSDPNLHGWPEGPPMGVLSDWSPTITPSFDARLTTLLKILAEDIKPYIQQILLKNPNSRIFALIATSHGDPGPISQLVSTNDIRLLSQEIYHRINYDKLTEVISDVLNINTAVVSAACASAIVATQLAAKKIENDNADIAVIFAADTVSKIAYTGFNRVGAMSKTGTRPFDINRDGMTASEGGVAFVLTNNFNNSTFPALTILGGGYNCDRTHMVEPSIQGILDAMREGCDKSQLSSSQVSFVYWHGTGTILNDSSEFEAANLFFNTNIPPGCSNKGNLGHTMGAAGAFNILGCCYSLLTNILPPSGRFESASFSSLNITNQITSIEAKIGLCISLGFGGINTSLFIKKINKND